MEIQKDKWYVCACGWWGLTDQEVINCIQENNIDGVYDTFEEALKQVEYLFEEVLDDDECCYIYHNGKIKEY